MRGQELGYSVWQPKRTTGGGQAHFREERSPVAYLLRAVNLNLCSARAKAIPPSECQEESCSVVTNLAAKEAMRVAQWGRAGIEVRGSGFSGA
jgi:hypothetical protein